MKTIIRRRDSGKARELIEAAVKENAVIITENKAALKVKAHGYGIDNVNICDYNDLGNLPAGQRIMIHNMDNFTRDLLITEYGLDLIGFSATEEA